MLYSVSTLYSGKNPLTLLFSNKQDAVNYVKECEVRRHTKSIKNKPTNHIDIYTDEEIFERTLKIVQDVLDKPLPQSLHFRGSGSYSTIIYVIREFMTEANLNYYFIVNEYEKYGNNLNMYLCCTKRDMVSFIHNSVNNRVDNIKKYEEILKLFSKEEIREKLADKVENLMNTKFPVDFELPFSRAIYNITCQEVEPDLSEE